MGIQRVTIDLDDKLVVDDVIGSLNLVNEYSSFLNCCRKLFCENENYNVGFFRRQANFVTIPLQGP